MKEEKILKKKIEKVFDSMHINPEMLEKIIEAIRSSASMEQDHYKEIIKELQAEHTKINNQMNRLTDLFLDGEFGEAEFREKRKLLEQRREEIIKEIESNNEADNDLIETLINVLKMAFRAEKTFKSFNIEEKRIDQFSISEAQVQWLKA